MKDIILGIQAIPFWNKYVVRIFRQPDLRHLGAVREYSAPYSDADRVRNLMKRYIQLNNLVARKIVEGSIERFKNSI